MNRVPRRSSGWLLGVVVLAVVVWQAGTDPFVTGLRSLDPPTLVIGTALAVPVTVAGAWRWHVVARRLGVDVDLGRAVGWCYRAQLLNAVLPGGVLGDVHRGVQHGRVTGSTGRALRAVAWERTAGQVVQGVIALLVLLVLPSPVRSLAPWAALVALAAVVLLLGQRTRPAGRFLRALRADVRHALLARAAWPQVVLASSLAVLGHVATYLLAARAVGVAAPVSALLPLVLLVLVAAGLPTNVAGWGPREGMAAWAFGAAGLGVELGVATAVAYGAIVAVATLPGAVVVVCGLVRRGGALPRPPVAPAVRSAAGGGAHA